MGMEKEAQEIFLESIGNQDPLSGMMTDSPTKTVVDVYPDPVTGPSYMSVLEFERDFPYNEWRVWMGRNWKLAVHITFFYIMGIFVGQKWMRGRQPYKIDNLLKIWNLSLAAFSFAGFCRSIPEVMQLLRQSNGFYRISCSRFVTTFSLPFSFFLSLFFMFHNTSLFFYALRISCVHCERKTKE